MALVRAVDRLTDGVFVPPAWDMVVNQSGVSISSSPIIGTRRYEVPAVIASGRRGDKLISLIAVDNVGAVLAGATLKAFRTLDDVANSLVADTREGPSVVSATDGRYTIPLPNADAHYIVAYKAGSPDVAGVTVNTLVGV